MFSIHFTVGGVGVSVMYVDSRPTEADVRECMAINGADQATVSEGFSVIATFCA